ncbi:MAG: hypothetical protein DMF63_00215 [Acidobacteria bacterium]|nr:MAG: hypothetical protein DMF63_00215 [Acidobacteriota bacterium]
MMILAFSVVPVTAARRAETVRVQINKEKKFAKSKLTIRFVELVEDSRCPTDAQCVWAGNAKIKIRVTANGRTKDLTLDTNGPHQGDTAEGFAIRLIGLTPAPKSNIRINRNGYVATLEAERLQR